MKIKVSVPFPYYLYTGNNKILFLEGETAGEVIDNLTRTYSRLRKHIYSDYGKIRSNINVYINNEDIKFLNDEDTILKENDIIKIIPSIAGGVQSSR